jgi:hypothetical protein
MSEDKKTVPEPGEARRDDDDEIHYHEVDETNVGGADQKPHGDNTQRPEAEQR